MITNPTAATALISMKSTQLKISRKWNSMMAGIKMKGKNGMFTPASFSHEYKLRDSSACLMTKVRGLVGRYRR